MQRLAAGRAFAEVPYPGHRIPFVGQRTVAVYRVTDRSLAVAVAKSYLGGGHDGEAGATANHYQVVVHADARSLAGGIGRADVPIETVKRLLCDCSLVTLTEDASGNPLDVGRKQRTVPTPLRRAAVAVHVSSSAVARGRTIPRHGYRLEDFVDDEAGDAGDADSGPSREGFRAAPNEVREPATVYRIGAPKVATG